MSILHKRMLEGAAILMSKSEQFIAVRKDGFKMAVDTAGEELKGLSKDELESKRHENRTLRNLLAEGLDDATVDFLSYYVTCSIVLDLWLPLLVLLILGFFCGGIVLVITAILFIANMVIFGVSAVLIRRQMLKVLGLYEAIGTIEGMITLCDYRGLEKFDLSRLPSIGALLD